MRQAAYRYLRVASAQGDLEETARIRPELSKHADREGFVLKDVTERSESAFYAVLGTLMRSEVTT